MPATRDIPRPMRAKHMNVRGDPAATVKHLQYIRDHIAADGFMFQQPKIDGMRILFDDGVARSRTWLPWTQRHLQAFAKDHADLIHGWDCEGLPGIHDTTNPDPNAFRDAMSGIRAEDGACEMTLFLFDNWDHSWQKRTYQDRLKGITEDLHQGVHTLQEEQWEHAYDGILFVGAEYRIKVIICPTVPVKSLDEINQNHLGFVAAGWEGSMLRRWRAPYKYNQATVREGWLIKIKDVEDDEAEIIGFEPAYENANELGEDAFGLAKRSSHKANLIPKDYLGCFNCRLIKNPSVEFSIGVLRGYSIEDRRMLLQRAEAGEMIGKIVKFEHQGYGGGYDKPRTPVMISFRDRIDTDV